VGAFGREGAESESLVTETGETFTAGVGTDDFVAASSANGVQSRKSVAEISKTHLSVCEAGRGSGDQQRNQCSWTEGQASLARWSQARWYFREGRKFW